MMSSPPAGSTGLDILVDVDHHKSDHQQQPSQQRSRENSGANAPQATHVVDAMDVDVMAMVQHLCADGVDKKKTGKLLTLLKALGTRTVVAGRHNLLVPLLCQRK
jgi:hypothetical protein